MSSGLEDDIDAMNRQIRQHGRRASLDPASNPTPRLGHIVSSNHSVGFSQVTYLVNLGSGGYSAGLCEFLDQ